MKNLRGINLQSYYTVYTNAMSSKENMISLMKFLLSKKVKNDLQILCENNGITKTGTKVQIINRLYESVSKDELFHEKPVFMLDWNEKLFLAVLLDGPKKRSGIIKNTIFKNFLKKINVERNHHQRICLDVFRWGKKSLVGGQLVQYKPETKKYSIIPETHQSLLGLIPLNMEEIAESFNQSILRPLKHLEIIVSKEHTTKIDFIKYTKKKPKILTRDQDVDVVRILAFSDWRVQSINDIFLFLQKIDPIDFIVYAGDDLSRFVSFDVNYFSELSKSTINKHVLAVSGNDDYYSTVKNVLQADGVHDLYDQTLIFKDFAFIGLESSTSGPAIFKHEEKDFDSHIKNQLKHIKDKRIIVVSHAPPYGILDRGIRYASEENGIHHIGSTALKNFIEKHHVDLVICGHCHSQGGIKESYRDTTIVNVSSHDDPGSKGNFAVIELSKNGLITISWHDTTEALDIDSPQRLHGIGPQFNEILERYDITTIGQLADAENYLWNLQASGISERLFRKFQLKAKSVINNETYQIAPFELPTSKLIYFDIETDVDCQRVWLIGILIDDEFRQLYADSWEQEKTILEEFISVLEQNPDRSLISYSCTNFDHRVILGALRRHELDTDIMERFTHIDIGTLLNRCFIFPNQSFALKELGVYLEYPFKNSDLNGLAVALSYHSHVEDGKPIESKIFEYNEDDVKAIPHIIVKARETSISLHINK